METSTLICLVFTMKDIEFGEVQYVGEAAKGLKAGEFFAGDCWEVYPKYGKFYFEYVPGEFGGSEKTVEISEEIYCLAIKTNPCHAEMCTLLKVW